MSANRRVRILGGMGRSRLRAAVLSAAIAAGLAVSPMPAHADISCQDLNRAFILGDRSVLADAAEMVRPLGAASDEVHAILHPADPPSQSSGFFLWPLWQLEGDCQALPSDTVGSIVATRMKEMERQKTQAIATMN